MIGRNDPCWCRSGMKYKHCHLNRGNQKPLEPFQVVELYKKAFSQETCLAPDVWLNECSSKIATAHTVPKSSSLKRISSQGHLYSFFPMTRHIDENNQLKSQGKLKPELLGINKASTFTGFCSRHDDAIFAPLEKDVFRGTLEQCFLLGYRALVREIYTKCGQKHSAALARNLVDRGKSYEEQRKIQEFYQAYQPAIEEGFRN